jgi:hypothetical protein
MAVRCEERAMCERSSDGKRKEAGRSRQTRVFSTGSKGCVERKRGDSKMRRRRHKVRGVVVGLGYGVARS